MSCPRLVRHDGLTADNRPSGTPSLSPAFRHLVLAKWLTVAAAAEKYGCHPRTVTRRRARRRWPKRTFIHQRNWPVADVSADLISALATGTHLDIAATDQIRPIATTTVIPIPVRILQSPLCRVELRHIGLTHFSGCSRSANAVRRKG